MNLNMKFISIFFIFIYFLSANPLQDAINKASAYDTIKLYNGVYIGNIIINKPITILGKGKNVEIRGDGNETVIKINSSNVTLKNLTITNSGNKFYNIDSAIKMKDCKECVIDRCHIKNTLYGIDMSMVKESNITNNTITSNGKDIEFRGNGLKLYYSSNNFFFKNIIENVKDITLNYSNNNIFKKNKFLNSRFATHLTISHSNVFENNFYQYNSVSIMIMGANNTKVINNKILSSKGNAGIGIVINGVYNFKFKKNIVKFNAKGIYIEGGEKGEGIKRKIIENEISYNKEAFHFHQGIKDNMIISNKIFGNIEDIVKDLPTNTNKSNIVKRNYWDRYEGFDRDGNNIGDKPYKIYQYSSRLWSYNNKVKFFYASPIMSTLNFISELAPFIEPNLLIEDSEPLLKL